MPKFLLHALWLPNAGLHVWVEQVEGHRIVTMEQVPESTFPPVVHSLLGGNAFRHRESITLQTPKGRQVKLRVPTAALGPDEAIRFLASIAFLDDDSPAATAAQREAIAPDLYWLIRMYLGLERFMKAGRVSIHVPFRDGQWFAQWQLGTGVEERGWLAEMIAAAPGVLTLNNNSLSDDMARTFMHWVVGAHLRSAGLAEQPRPFPWHDFVHSLLNDAPLRRGGSQLARQIGNWNGSITAVNLQLTFIVEAPKDDEVGQDEQWPVRVQVRAGSDAPRPVHYADYDAATMQTLRAALQRAIDITGLVDYTAHPRGPQTARTSNDGDWDVYLTDDEIVEFVAHDAARLRLANFTVLLPRAWATAETSAKLHVTRHREVQDTAAVTRLGLDTLVDFDWRISINGQELDEDEMQQLVRSKSGLIKLRGQWVLADTRQIERTKRYMEKLRSTEDTAAVTAAELRQLALETSANGNDVPVEFSGESWFTSLVGGMDRPAPERVEVPPTVHADLRDYQRRGVDWLYYMSRNQLGAVLADDMGLGKTLQLLTLLAVEHEQQRAAQPTLIVAPTSVVGNWAREAQRFVPALRVYVHHGGQRLAEEALQEALGQHDITITSYGVMARDVDQLAQRRWDHVVLDEAQAIKNSGTQAAKSVRRIPARHRIALTGTPIENKLAELRSLLDFVNPGILGSQTFFRNHFAKVIESRRDEALADEMGKRLQRLTAPFILRRLKTDPAIIDDLPEKQEQVLAVEMTKEQAALYTALVDSMKAQLEEREGVARRGLVLATITRIKQICNHPAHFLGDGSAVTVKGRHRSGKVAKLVELLDDAIRTDQRVLIFTQYKAFGDILQPYLGSYLGEVVPFLHGGVTKSARDSMVEHFQSPDGPRAMILSLKAGGTGLNLTAASVVVHMDRWWNPAVENQATDRAFRIGQRQDVSVYKMMTIGTLEESIQDVLDGKMQLAGAVVGEGEGWITELDTEDLAQLMSYRGQQGGQ